MEIGISKAKQICNAVQKNFPYDSPWKHYNIDYRELMKHAQSSFKTDEFLNAKKLIDEEEKRLQKVRESCYSLQNSPFTYFKELIKAVHKYKIKNCGETTRIAYAIARMNGVKHADLDMALLTTKEPKDYSKSLFPNIDRILNTMKEMEYGGGYKVIDHVALQIHGKKGKEFIIDALLDECSSKNEIEKIYKTKYGDILRISETENIQILNGTSETGNIPHLKDDEAQELLTLNPELGIFKQAPIAKKKFFFNWFTGQNK